MMWLSLALGFTPDDDLQALIDGDDLPVNIGLEAGIYTQVLSVGDKDVRFVADEEGLVVFQAPPDVGGQQIRVGGGGAVSFIGISFVSDGADSITLDNGELRLSNVRFDGGVAGRALKVLGGSVSIENSTFDGGFSAVGGQIDMEAGQVEVTNSRFRNGRALTRGGAISIAQQGSLSVSDTTFSNNEAGVGGALWCEGACSIRRTRFLENRATRGGALFRPAGAPTVPLEPQLTIVASEFFENEASTDGGAMSVFTGGVSVETTTFCRNTAIVNGGALALGDLSAGSSLKNLRFLLNEVTTSNTPDARGGGAVYIVPNVEPVQLELVNLLGNSAFAGAAVSGPGRVVASQIGFQRGPVFTPEVQYTRSETFANETPLENDTGIQVLRNFSLNSSCSGFDDFLGARFVALSDLAAGGRPAGSAYLRPTSDEATGFLLAARQDADNDGVPAWLDCNDTDPLTRPRNLTDTTDERDRPDGVRDGLDTNCTGLDDLDQDNDGFRIEQDCDDDDPLVFPGAPDLDPFQDRNCNGIFEDSEPVLMPRRCAVSGRTATFGTLGWVICALWRRRRENPNPE